MIKALIGLLLSVGLLGCPQQKQEQDLPETPPSATATGTPIAAQNQKILLENKTRHLFSDPSHEDLFQIVLIGEELLAAEVNFTIQNAAGQEIYKDTFPSRDLLGYGLMEISQNPTNEDRKNYIQKRVASFFEKASFSQPAIPAKAVFDAEMYNKEAWDLIHKNPQIIGFYYLTGEENGRSIVFSPAQNKAIVYLNCC